MTPLVFVHGFMGGSKQWALQEPLAEKRDLIRIDLPGFGENAHLEPLDRIESFATWVLGKLESDGVRRFDLLGHSMGGMVAQAMIRQAPDRVEKLILYGTGAVGVLPGRFEPIETSIERARDDGPRATARRIAATWFRRGEAAPEYPTCAAIAQQAALPAIVAGLEAMRNWSGEDHLPKISALTLILWGDCDRTYAWPQIEMLWRNIPNSNLAVAPGCAHAVHLERPKLFNELVKGFLPEEGSSPS